MTNTDFFEALKGQFGDKIIAAEEPYGFATIEIDRADILEIIGWLRDHESLKMNFLTDLCGMHFPENKGKELGVVYHLHSFENNYRARVKAFFPIEDPTAPSLTGLFAGANWMERETFDFYGIQFTGHPDLRRILNVDDMDYHPLRKQYALEDETRTDKTDSFFGR